MHYISMARYRLAHPHQALLADSASKHEDSTMTSLETVPLSAPSHASSRSAHRSRNSILHYIPPVFPSSLAIAQNREFLPMLSHLLQSRHSFTSAEPY